MNKEDLDRFSELYKRFMNPTLQQLSDAEVQELFRLFELVAEEPGAPQVIMDSVHY